uniref:uncharacterized protein LOC120329584 isoform X2 n=1 Tax=Styela clava TaxID=7725 RepID=UPI00193A4A82|nr:uncharacterized protein LOC120329584 isoform X2 [Styela clava]
MNRPIITLNIANSENGVDDSQIWDEWENLTEEEIESCLECIGPINSAENFDKSPPKTLHHTLTTEEASQLYSKAAHSLLLRCHVKVQSTPPVVAIDTIKSIAISHRKLKLDDFYMEYSKQVTSASQLLGLPQAIAAQLLIKLYDEVASFKMKTPHTSDYQTTGINAREAEFN